MFFRELGITPSEELRALYHELSNQLNATQTDLYSIKAALSEPEANDDAFYCDFEVFRSLYRLEARSVERTGQGVFVGLLTLHHTGGTPPQGEMVTKCMALLLKILHQCLRRGDVISRFSLSQYILLLPTITLENAEMVLRRVTDRYGRQPVSDEVTLEMKLQPLDPAM